MWTALKKMSEAAGPDVNVRRESAGAGRLCRTVLLASHVSLLTAVGMSLVACDAARMGGGVSLGGDDGRERWTIRVFRSETANHAEQAGMLADMLKKVDGLDAGKVRVSTQTTGSSIYYGEYVKVPSAERGRLVFPPEYQRDFELIRRLTLNQATPFAYAEPELLQKGKPVPSEYDVSQAKGTHTLLIAVFYNSPDLSEREEAARQYVRALREAGYAAYDRHEELRSYVFVGDFDASDIIKDRGATRMGPRVEQFIKSNEAEFRYLTENGRIVKRIGPEGKGTAPLSYLVPVPKAAK